MVLPADFRIQSLGYWIHCLNSFRAVLCSYCSHCSYINSIVRFSAQRGNCHAISLRKRDWPNGRPGSIFVYAAQRTFWDGKIWALLINCSTRFAMGKCTLTKPNTHRAHLAYGVCSAHMTLVQHVLSATENNPCNSFSVHFVCVSCNTIGCAWKRYGRKRKIVQLYSRG